MHQLQQQCQASAAALPLAASVLFQPLLFGRLCNAIKRAIRGDNAKWAQIGGCFGLGHCCWTTAAEAIGRGQEMRDQSPNCECSHELKEPLGFTRKTKLVVFPLNLGETWKQHKKSPTTKIIFSGKTGARWMCASFRWKTGLPIRGIHWPRECAMQGWRTAFPVNKHANGLWMDGDYYYCITHHTVSVYTLSHSPKKPHACINVSHVNCFNYRKEWRIGGWLTDSLKGRIQSKWKAYCTDEEEEWTNHHRIKFTQLE